MIISRRKIKEKNQRRLYGRREEADERRRKKRGFEQRGRGREMKKMNNVKKKED